MDRSAFIEAMIAELMLQKQTDEAAFNQAAPTKDVAAIFRAMCYDFPTVDDADLLALAAAVREYAPNHGGSTSTHDDAFRTKFWLHGKFLENLVYLSSISPQATEPSRERAMGC